MRPLFLILALLQITLPVFGQNDTATDCTKLDFTKLPSTCCKIPFGDLLVASKLPSGLTDCKSSSSLLAWGNSYKLNLLQSKNLKNFPDATATAFKKEACAAGAFMSCVFTRNNFLLSNGTVDIPTLSAYMVNLAPDATWKSIMTKILNPMNPNYATSYAFTDIVEDNFESVTCSSGTVNLMPLMMMQMLQSELTWMCPQQNVYTTKNNCETLMNNFQYCDDKIYSSSAKGIFYFAV